MQNFKAYLDQKKYDELIQIQNQAETGQDASCVLCALCSKGMGKEALAYLLKNRELLWSWNPLFTMKYDFECRFVLGQFEEAYEDLSYFNNLNYVSQEVEEFLRSAPKRIREAEKDSFPQAREMEVEEIQSILHSEKDSIALLSLLNRIKNHDLMPYLQDLHALIADDSVDDDVKSYVLMLLSAHHDQATVSFQKGGKKFTLIPAEVRMPYSSSIYQTIRSKIIKENDPSLSEIAGEILDQFALCIYPDSLKLPATEPVQLPYLYLAKRYLGSKEPETDPVASFEANRIELVLQKAQKHK